MTEKSQFTSTTVVPELPPVSKQMSDYLDQHKDSLQTKVPVELLPRPTGDVRQQLEERRKNARELSKNVMTIISLNETIKQSQIDPTTGLRNRAAFDKELPSIFDRVKAGELTVAYFDLNGLKRVNDNLGHDQGDKYLRKTAEALKISLRPTDLIYRVGGDELVAILNGPMDEDVMKTVSARLKDRAAAAVAELQLPEDMYTGLSVGAAIKSEDDTVESLLKSADTAAEADKRAFYNELEQATGQNLRR